MKDAMGWIIFRNRHEACVVKFFRTRNIDFVILEAIKKSTTAGFHNEGQWYSVLQ